MNYTVFILRRAQKELASLPAETYERTKSAIMEPGSRPKTKWMSEIDSPRGLTYSGGRLSGNLRD